MDYPDPQTPVQPHWLFSFLTRHRTDPSSLSTTFDTDMQSYPVPSPLILRGTINGRRRQRFFIDEGSGYSFISTAAADKLQLPRRVCDVGIATLDPSTPPVQLREYVLADVTLNGRHLPACPLIVSELTCSADVLVGRGVIARAHICRSGLVPPTSAGFDDAPALADEAVQPQNGFDMNRQDTQGRRAQAFTDTQQDTNVQHDADYCSRLRTQINPELVANAAIPATAKCSHPDATVHLHLPAGTRPVFVKPYPIPHVLHAFVSSHIQELLEAGTIRLCTYNNGWNFPILVTPKKDIFGKRTGHRFCLDPRGINKIIPDFSVPIPLIQNLFHRLAHHEVYSIIDLSKAFNQFPVAAGDQEKLSFSWNGSKYCYQGAPFGLKTLTPHVQALMQEILEPCKDFVSVFVDDIVIYSRSKAEHAEHIRCVLRCLNRHNLRINIDKCAFGYRQLNILGHIFTAGTLRPDRVKLASIQNFPTPSSPRQLRSFLGMANYLRMYVPLYSSVAAPLEALRHIRKTDEFRRLWSPECQASFVSLQNILTSDVVLHFPVPNIPYHIAVDASGDGMGACLYQVVDDEKHYISFASKALNSAQRAYSANRSELLAIVFSLQRFREYVYGTHFTVHTDHMALTSLHNPENQNRYVRSWLDVLLEYDFTIVHIPGERNVIPDFLSRYLYTFLDTRPLPSPAPDPASLITVPTVAKASHPKRTLESFVRERLDKTAPSLHLRPQLLDQHHSNGHFGAEALFQSLWDAGFYWPTMRAECRQHFAACVDCQRHNLTRQGFHPARTVHAQYPFDHIAVDLFQFPHRTRNGHAYCLVYTDICTRFTILRPLPDKTMQTVARELYSIFCTVGFPVILQSDNGTEFRNSLLTELAQLTGINHRFITPYYPQGNGAAESHVKLAQNALLKLLEGNTLAADLYLPSVQFAINTRLSGRSKARPYEHALVRPLTLPANSTQASSHLLSHAELDRRIADAHSLLFPALHRNAVRSSSRMANSMDGGRKLLARLPVGTRVMRLDTTRSSKYQPRYVGPFLIADAGPTSYQLQDEDGTILPNRVTPSHLKVVPANKEHTEDSTFEIDTILSHSGTPGTDTLRYHVKWKGFDETSWEPYSSFNDTQSITDYWKNHERGTMAHLSQPTPAFSPTHATVTAAALPQPESLPEPTLAPTRSGRVRRLPSRLRPTGAV